MKFSLKKPVKILLFVVASLIALFLLISLLISPIAHWYIEKNSKQLCHRIVTMDKLRINLFNGSVDIQGFKALEENDHDKFFTFKELYVNANLWKLIGKNVCLTEISLDNIDATVLQNGKRFNFTDIIKFYTKDKKDKDTTKSAWTVDLQNITLQGGNVEYRDEQVGSCFKFRQLAISIPQIYFNSEKTDVGLNLKFANGGDLAMKLLYSLEKSTYDLTVNLKKFDIAVITPYLQQFLNLSNFQGSLSTNLDIHGNLNHILEITGAGDIAIQQLCAHKNDSTALAKIDNINLKINKIDTKKKIYHLSSVTCQGAHVNYEVFENGNTFSHLLANEDTTSSTPTDTAAGTNNIEQSLQFCIDNVSITNSDVNYTDHTLQKTFTLPVSQINIQASHVSFTEPMSLKMKALVGETGQLVVDGESSLNNFSNLKLNAYLSNFKLNAISPYSIEYLAYPISDGVLSFVSTNTIQNNYLDSKNKIDIYNCVVDKKLKDVKGQYKLPLRAAVFVLTDRKGNINLELPVSGDITSPTFSYRKIIWKTFCNLIIKVAAAPIDLIAKAIGGEPDIFADIEYAIHPQGLGSENNDRLNKIVEAMKAKPEMILTLQQSFNMEENMKAYALFDAKCEFYKSTHTDFTIEDFENIENISTANPDFIKFVNSKVVDHSVGTDIGEKCLKMADKQALTGRVQSNIERRKKMINNLFETQGISSSRLEWLPAGVMKTAKGKTILSFGIKFNE